MHIFKLWYERNNQFNNKWVIKWHWYRLFVCSWL